MRPHSPGCRAAAPHRDHRQRCADGLHGTQDRLGARPRTGGLGPRGARPAAEGLPAPPAHRRLRDRQGRRLGHDPLRPRRPRPGPTTCWPRSESHAAGCRRPSRDRRSRASSARTRRSRPACAPERRSSRAAAIRPRTPSASGRPAPGVVALSLGTSGVVFAATDAPVFDPGGRVHAFCHAVPGRWHLMSVMLSAAGSLRWFRDAVAPGVRVRRSR